MSKQVLFLIGPPGSGKDTQAIWLTEEFGMMQVPSSQIIRKKFAEQPDDPVIQREKVLFDTGKYNTPELVAEWIMEYIRPLAGQGVGLIFSGSPRTEYEARVEFPEVLRLYGDRNVRVIHIQLSEEVALRRIAGRRLCAAHKHPIPDLPEYANLTVCPKDGSPLERRALDDASLQDARFKEYRERGEPCLNIAEECGVAVFTVDGSKSIEAIHHDIVEIIDRHRMPLL